MKKESFKQGITDGIPIALGYLAVSFTFGMMAVQGGLTIWQAVLISLTNLTSAGQFAGLDIIIAGGSLWEIALTQLIINLRYCLMSFSLSQKLRRDEPWGHRYAVAFGVTDEIFGVSASKTGKVSAFYNYGYERGNPGMDSRNPAWCYFWKYSSCFYYECTWRCHLRNVSGGHHTTIKNKQSCASGSAWIYGCEHIICLGSCIIKRIIRICDYYHYNSGSRTGSMALPGGRRECQGGSS